MKNKLLVLFAVAIVFLLFNQFNLKQQLSGNTKLLDEVEDRLDTLEDVVERKTRDYDDDICELIEEIEYISDSLGRNRFSLTFQKYQVRCK